MTAASKYAMAVSTKRRYILCRRALAPYLTSFGMQSANALMSSAVARLNFVHLALGVQEPKKELLEDMQRQQIEIEMLSTELDESQGQLRVLRASETQLQGNLTAKTALLSFQDDVIAQCAPCSILSQLMGMMLSA